MLSLEPQEPNEFTCKTLTFAHKTGIENNMRLDAKKYINALQVLILILTQNHEKDHF